MAIATADLRVSIAQLRSQHVPLRQRQDSVPRAQAMYEQAWSQHNRMQRLYREGAISKAQLDQAKAQMQVAQVDLASAQVALDMARELEREQIKQWQFQHQLKLNAQKQQLAEMRRHLELARLQHQYTTQRLEMLRRQWPGLWGKAIANNPLVVRATDTGVVGNLPVAIAERIFTGKTLVGLAKLGSLNLRVPVSASSIGSLHIGQRAVVRVGTGAAVQKFSATVVTINSLPAKNLTYTVEVQFNNFESALLVGQSAQVRFLPD